MPRQKPTAQLASLKKHQADLAAKMRAANSKIKAEAKERERLKNEQAGALALKELAVNPSSSFAAKLLQLLNAGVTSSTMRAELELEPLPKRSKAATSEPPPHAAPSPAPVEAVAAPPPVIHMPPPRPPVEAPPPAEPERAPPSEPTVSGVLGGLAARFMPRTRQT